METTRPLVNERTLHPKFNVEPQGRAAGWVAGWAVVLTLTFQGGCRGGECSLIHAVNSLGAADFSSNRRCLESQSQAQTPDRPETRANLDHGGEETLRSRRRPLSHVSRSIFVAGVRDDAPWKVATHTTRNTIVIKIRVRRAALTNPSVHFVD